MPAGRPTTLTPSVQEAILDALRKGHSQPIAAAAAGVPYKTLLAWLYKGRQEESDRLYREFAAEVEIASEAGLVECERCLIRGGQEDPRVALAILERRMPEQWRRRDRIEHTGEDGGPVKVDLGKAVSDWMRYDAPPENEDE